MLKKIASVILSVMMTVSIMSVYVSAQEMQTSSVMQEYGATAVRWNGKTALKSGKTYAVTGNVTVSKKVVIPSGTTLIVMKGAKLWVSGSGSLYIQGKLTVKSGGVLAVTGRLYQYKSKNLLNYGEIRFSNKSNVTLNGKTTVYTSGTVTGTPKALSVGPNADITCKGKNYCKGLDKYIDRTAMETCLYSFFTRAVQKTDIFGAVKLVMSADYISDLDKALISAGSSLEELCSVFGDEYVNSIKEQGIDPADVKSVDVRIKELSETILNGDQAVVAGKYYNGAEKIYLAECEVAIKIEAHTYTEDTEVCMVKHGGKWYLLG